MSLHVSQVIIVNLSFAFPIALLMLFPLRIQRMTSRSYFSSYSHYSLLATVEAIFNLGTLGRNDTSAAPMSDMFRGEIP